MAHKNHSVWVVAMWRGEQYIFSKQEEFRGEPEGQDETWMRGRRKEGIPDASAKE